MSQFTCPICKHSFSSNIDNRDACFTCQQTPDYRIWKLQHQLEIQTKRVENLKDYVKLHLPPIFDSECEGCRCAEIASVKGLRIDQELEKQLEVVK